MTKFTPGPWNVGGTWPQIVAVYAGALYVAHAVRNYQDVAEETLAHPTEAEAVANAHLIAAAPELLAALQALKEDREYQRLSGGKYFTSAPTEMQWKRESAQKAWALAEAAIVKALSE